MPEVRARAWHPVRAVGGLWATYSQPRHLSSGFWLGEAEVRDGTVKECGESVQPDLSSSPSSVMASAGTLPACGFHFPPS